MNYTQGKKIKHSSVFVGILKMYVPAVWGIFIGLLEVTFAVHDDKMSSVFDLKEIRFTNIYQMQNSHFQSKE